MVVMVSYPGSIMTWGQYKASGGQCLLTLLKFDTLESIVSRVGFDFVGIYSSM